MPAASPVRRSYALSPPRSPSYRLPVGRWIVLGGDDVARAGLLFPLVGASIGAAVDGTAAAALAGTLSPLLAVTLGVALGTILTAALRLGRPGEHRRRARRAHP